MSVRRYQGRSKDQPIRRGRRAVEQEAAAHGVQPSYIDELGEPRAIKAEHLRRILALIKSAPTSTAVPDGETAQGHPGRRNLSLPTCLVLRTDRLPGTVTVTIPSRPAAEEVVATWTFRNESGAIRTASVRPTSIERTGRQSEESAWQLVVPLIADLHPGYYDASLVVRTGMGEWSGRAQVVIAPPSCYLPSAWQSARKRAATGNGRWWGISVQLYGVRSRRNWGIGDFRDLADLLKWGASLGAAMIGVNPLHALLPGAISPYSPSSRLFHNPLYLDIESIAEFREDAAIQAATRSARFQRRLERLRHAPLVEYEAVTDLKWRMLRRLYRTFSHHHLKRHTARARQFHRFVREQGEPLERFATFEALSRRFTRRGEPTAWISWPEAYRHPSSPAVRRFTVKRCHDIGFYQYLQWQCQLQLARAAKTAARIGLPIGLYTDFAVGIDPNGADAWAYQDVLVSGASVGAPPDRFSPKGQDWGLRPPHPVRLRETRYRFFIESYRRNLQHSGLLRLDHAMNLFRLFWVPQGHPATEGAYVTYPADDLLGILSLESRRQQVIVVGEDLGTVTSEIRASLMQHGLLSYRLLLFEKTTTGAFAPPYRYPAQAMAAVTTHDLPTLRGFWRGRDIEQKERLGLYPDGRLPDADRAARERDRIALIRALKQARVLHHTDGHGDASFEDELTLAVYRYLARTPCYLLAVTLEDLLGDLETPNIPCADPRRYPVWRRKAGPDGMTFEHWARLPGTQRVAAMLRAERPITFRRRKAGETASAS